jgi:hypothetical protein
MAGSSNTDISPITASIISIVPLEGDPETEVPIYRPDVEFPPGPRPQFDINIPFTFRGFEVNVPIRFGPPTPFPLGVVIPFTFAPTANFNPQIDVDLGLNPTFGLDIDLEFIIPIGGNPAVPTPLPGQEPIELPPVSPPGSSDCEEFDYERIEDFIIANRCCNPITDVQNVGTFTFETPNQVANFSVPDNAVAVFIGIVAGENTRVYKLAGSDAEFAHGNASVTVRGNALQFERLYVNNHVLFYPESSDSKGVRISCQQGTVVTVNAGLYVPIEEA